MREHGDRAARASCRGAGRERELAPGGDPTIRAHLRFVATALTRDGRAAAGATRLEGFADELPEWFDESLSPSTRTTSRPASAPSPWRSTSSSGPRPGSDPSLDAGLDRRVRIGGWIRIFLLGMEARLGPSADGLGDQVLAQWARASASSRG